MSQINLGTCEDGIDWVMEIYPLVGDPSCEAHDWDEVRDEAALEAIDYDDEDEQDVLGRKLAALALAKGEDVMHCRYRGRNWYATSETRIR